ncbi:MAG: RtcB family protein [Coriobacteriia bacterium]|nr:RtcB family protein [Coriobacteriia bacterium]
MRTLTGSFGTGVIYNPDVEFGAVEQVVQLLNTPLAQDANLRVMPDVHAGAGSVIGTTMQIHDKVCPNLVGVDIGCGLMAVPLVGLSGKDGDDDLNLVELDRFIRKNIPSGFAKRTSNKLSPLADRTDIANLRWDAPSKYRSGDAHASVGTLGGGNHFIEVGVDADGEKWLTIHSGSRNIGLQVATHYQKLAERTCDDDVPNALKYLTGSLMESYLHDMQIMQEYADLNRIAMLVDILDYLGLDLDDDAISTGSVRTVHNYIEIDNDDNSTAGSSTLRKGAVRARADELFLLPLNMADGILLCRGKGNADWNESAPHGAGRTLSRSAAFKLLDMAEFERRMNGIYSTSVHNDTLDESPMAYKDGRAIEELMLPTADRIDRWTPIYSFKARGNSRKGGNRSRGDDRKIGKDM